MARGARLLAALSLALLVGYALGEFAGDDSSYWVVLVCLLIALVTGLPSITGGWTMLAGLASAPFFAWSFVAAYEHPLWAHEPNDALLGFLLWLTNSVAVIVSAIVIALVRKIRGTGSAN